MIPSPPADPEETSCGLSAALDRPIRIALAHDWLVNTRGGERVLDRIARLVHAEHEATNLYTLVENGTPISEAVDVFPRTTSPLQRIAGGSGRARRWLLPLYPWAVGRLSRRLAADHARDPIDLLISTSSAAIKGLRPPLGVPHLCYCHTPARYLWSQSARYARSGLMMRAGLGVFGRSLRSWDRSTSPHVTRFLANSTHIAREIKRCYDRPARVVFPPVRTVFFTPDPAIAREDFWLVVGAMEPYKRTELAIKAAALAKRELRIVGEGSQLKRIERLVRQARTPVVLLGRVDDDQLRDLYRRASALLFPQVEDFGIVAVEAQACGCPVIARRAGGALDTVLDPPGELASDRTGALFEDDDPAGIVRAAARIETIDPAACRRHAERFSEAVFDDAMRAQIRLILSGET